MSFCPCHFGLDPREGQDFDWRCERTDCVSATPQRIARQLYEALGAIDAATPGGIMLMPWMASETKAAVQAAIDAWEYANPPEMER